ncbi:hypothetical protein DYB25_003089 [Aphanomyces astaci]|uniref:Uncharacterized protein n=1 Tax=Aphanomyces astaci TaxID=112090 RepID=A0A396ZM48_APHAT|nr:hypothetical protein DYB25_003089 [Aphanomyces astaci]
MDELPSKLRDTTALCWAAGTGNVDMLRRLLTEGVDVNLADYDRRTPLHIAASDGNAEEVKLLIQAGANCHAKDRWGVTPLDCAKDAVVASLMSTHIRASLFADTSTAPYRRIATGDTEALKRAWLDGLALNAVDGGGRTALHVAVEKEQMNAIELLLSAGATVDVADDQGRTPMSIAVEMNASNVLSLFRRHVYTASSLPQVPITLDVPHAFAAIQHDDLARLQQLVPRLFLVQVGANVNLLDRWGNSPLSEAMHFAHTDVATYLRDHHATEHGLDDNSLAKSPHQLDSTLLNTALEHILRCVCRALPEDPDEVHRIQRLVKAVVLLCVLRHESTATMSRFQYCQALEHACTGQGELTAVDTVAPDDGIH